MNKQLNIRLPKELREDAQTYMTQNGFESIQDLIKESLRSTVYEERLTTEEIDLTQRFVKGIKEKKIPMSDKNIFQTLRSRK